jgi:predicted acylesterase/phospholipase RssA
MPKMALVLQGGGALGAYEYGAVCRLVELGWEPVAVAGVSIGAATAAAIAGAFLLIRLQGQWAMQIAPASFALFGRPMELTHLTIVRMWIPFLARRRN